MAQVIDAKTIQRYRENLQGEIDATALYRTLAATESRPELAEVYRKLADTEERHGQLWQARLEQAGQQVPPPRPSLRTRLVGGLARRFGVGAVLPLILRAEAHDMTMYDNQPEAVAAGLPRDERSHARIFQQLGSSS